MARILFRKSFSLTVAMLMECVTKKQEEEEEAKKKPMKTSPAAAAATNGNSEEEEETSETEVKEEEESGSDSEFEAPEDVGPVQKKQKVSKKSSKTDSSDDELNDAELAKKLQDEENGGRRTRTRSKPRKPPKAKSEKKPGARKGTSTYSKPCILSPELARIMGTERMARKDVVVRMWAIVKERQLQDPRNKQFMICDEDLQKVFGVRRLRTFGMMKYLKNHIKDVKDVCE